jgi:hypothetical protein
MMASAGMKGARVTHTRQPNQRWWKASSWVVSTRCSLTVKGWQQDELRIGGVLSSGGGCGLLLMWLHLTLNESLLCHPS